MHLCLQCGGQNPGVTSFLDVTLPALVIHLKHTGSNIQQVVFLGGNTSKNVMDAVEKVEK